MYRLSSRLARGSRRALTSHPARAGFHPAAAALAVATAFSWPVALRAQPVGGQAIAGQASFVRNGANLLVITQNAPNANFSAINWQSFSVPVGSVTQFNQPSATSTSINRVLGSDPSSIFGTLTSNGRLVLVNPAGIAVGTGAVVDTAGFTASTLPMSEADAIAGRLRFAGYGGALQVDGSIVARSGDVVLIAPTVQAGSEAIVQANGATVLAAGQKVEITGRGLEGIRLEVQAPENQAVNLGALKGDAVGIFAGTLKHSGLVRAQAVTAEGGKVLLKAQGDNLVGGAVQGRNIDVLGERVGLLAGAAVDASGPQGGGQVRIGGDYQGKNADVVNARQTYVDAQATVKADATAQGNGGRVIIWSDEATQMHGQVSARGGAQGGNGGFVEVSGKQRLAFTGRVDTRAPNGKTGKLLLDPEDIEINSTGANSGPGTSGLMASTLSSELESNDVEVMTSLGSMGPQGGKITLAADGNVNWTSGNTLSLHADNGISLQGTVSGVSVGVANGQLNLYSANGDITQTAGSVVEVATLVAGAAQGKVLLDVGTSNRVGTLTGYAFGPTAEFRFTNAAPLTIGTVSNGFTTGTGISTYDGGSIGDIAVAATSGNLSVDQAGTFQGRNIALHAPAGDVGIETTNVYANGALDIAAASAVNIHAAWLEGGAGGVTIAAGAVNVAGPEYSTIRSHQSPIDVRTSAGNLDGTFATFQSGGGLNGTIHLEASGTGASVFAFDVNSNGSFSGLPGGGIALLAKGSVQPQMVRANGSSMTDGDAGKGGAINIVAETGSVLSNITATGGTAYGSIGAGGAGGALTLAAGTAAFFGADLRGGSSEAGAGGTGGALTAEVSAGNLLAFGADTSGGSGNSGGAGGPITLRALGTGATVQVQSTLSSNGGSGSGGSGAHAGDVLVEAASDVTTSYVYANGGGAGAASAQAGAGGSIAITSNNGSISMGNADPSLGVWGGASANGGYGYTGANGGTGGSIRLSALGVGPGAGDIFVRDTLQANGGGSDAGAGGSARVGPPAAIEVQATGSVQLQKLEARGGAGGGGGGGHAGSVLVLGADVSVDEVDVRGGAGASEGGYAGAFRAEAYAGNVQVFSIDASGGDGAGSAGEGGAGGAVVLRAPGAGGSVILQSDIALNGGNSGLRDAGRAGNIVVEADGDARLVRVFANGGSSGGAGWSGGSGGTISITSNNANVRLADPSFGSWGGAQASGGAGYSGASGGSGGAIHLGAPAIGPGIGQVLVVDPLIANGGATQTGLAGAAQGGGQAAVDVAAGGDIQLLGGAQANGGTAWYSTGGAAGSVNVSSSNGNVSLGSIQAQGSNGGSVLALAGGDLSTSGIDVSARYANSFSAGGTGGSIVLDAGGGITASGNLDASGGDSLTYAGGDGGTVTVGSSAGMQLASVYASGGVSYQGAGAGLGGTIQLTASNGDIEAATLEANGIAGGNVTVLADNGNVHLGWVYANGGYNPAAGGNGGTVQIEAAGAAAGGVTVDSMVEATGGSSDEGTVAGRGGNITVSGTGPVYVNTARAYGGSINATMGSGNGGAGGAIVLQSLADSLTINSGADASGGYGPTGGAGGTIDLLAGGSLQTSFLSAVGGYDPIRGVINGAGGVITAQATGDLTAGGVDVTGGAGGRVTLASSGGNLVAQWISASATNAGAGGIGGQGGTVMLRAMGTAPDTGSITLASDIDANGGGAGDGGTGGRGGSIDIAANGLVQVNRLDAQGGTVEASTSSGAGGRGGDVVVSSTAGSVQLYEIHVDGGRGAPGGDGGSVQLLAPAGGISGSVIAARGGDGNLQGAAGGRGGAIDMQALDDVQFGSSLLVHGGAGDDAAGGQGGDASLVSNAGSIFASDIMAYGGGGSPGGAGGNINVQAALDVGISDLYADGNDGYASTGGAAGGDGGSISVKFGGSMSPAMLSAEGGWGQQGGTAPSNGGAGGHGGTISLQQTGTGDLALESFGLVASGGFGGDASGAGGAGGNGGNGGSVSVSAAGGSVSLAGSSLAATARSGGINGDDTTYAPEGATTGSILVRAAHDLDVSNVDLYLGRSSFTGLAAGSVNVEAPITTRGTAVTLRAGDGSVGLPDPNATLTVRGSIDTTEAGAVAGGPLWLSAPRTVLLDSAMTGFMPGPDNFITGGTTTVSAPQVIVGATTQIGSSDGELQIIADDLQLDGYANSGTNRTVIKPFTAARPIRLGGVEDPGGLTVTQDELTRVTAGTLVVGDGMATGGLSIEGPVTLDPGYVPALSLINAGNIAQQLGAALSVSALNADGASVVLNETSIGVLSGRSHGGSFTVTSQSGAPVEIGTVDGVAGIAAQGPVSVTGATQLQLNAGVSSDAGGDAVVLSADTIWVGASGGISTPNGRWLAYLAGNLGDNSFGTLASGNHALWGRSYPGTVAETGNRYVFAYQPTVDVYADAATKVYDGNPDFGALTYVASPLVDAAAYGNVFLQDTFSGALDVPGATRNVGSYAIGQGTLDVAGYAVGFTSATASITPRTLNVGATGQDKVYNGTTAATVNFNDDRVALDDLTVSGSAAFADRNVGSGKLVSVTGIGISGADAGNYVVGNDTAASSANITPALLTVNAVADSRGYDGSTASAGAPAITGTIYGPDVGVFAQVFDNRNAGTGKTLMASGLVNDGNGGNNYAVSFVPNTSGVITPAALTITAVADSRGYDGSTASAGAPTITGTIYGPDAGAFAQVFDNRNVGTNKTLTASGLVNDGNGGANYALSFVTSTGGVITPASLTVTAAADSRGYDGTTASSAAPTISGIVYSPDAPGFTQSFDNRNAGNGKTLTASGLVNDGNGGNNYAVSFVPNTSGIITQAALTVTAVTDSRGYDGTTASSTAPTVSGIVYSPDAPGFSQSFDNRNAGNGKTLTASGLVNDGNSGGNYAVTFVPNAGGEITPAALTVTAVADTRGYNGTLNSSATPAVSGTIYGPDTGAFAQSFDSRNAGTNKTLTAGGLVNDGNGGNNYAVSFVPNGGGEITRAPLSVKAVSDTRGYDGTVASAGSPTVSGTLYVPDTGAFSQTFDNRNAGTGKTITASGVVNDGNGGGNYAVTFVTDTTGVITPAPLTVTAVTDSRTYDGTTHSGGAPTLSGTLFGSDAGAFSQAFDNRNAGTGKTLTASGLVNDGNGGGNYAVSFVTDTTGAITPAPLTVTAVADSRTYNGTTSSSGMPAIAGTIYGSDASAFGQTFDDRNAGTGKTLTAAGTVNDGNGGANYAVSFVDNTSGTITPASLTVTAAADSRVYDGSTASLKAPGVTGTLYGSDAAAFGQSFDNRNAGTGKTLTASGTVNDGNGGNNYSVSFVSSTNGVITPAPLTVSAVADSRGYDGTSASAAGPNVGTLFGSDSPAFSQSFDTRNAGGNKKLTASGSVNDGNGGANYAVAFVANTSGTITPAPLTVTAAADARVYDSTVASSAAPTVTGTIYGPDSGGFSQSFDTRHAATGKTLTPAGSVNDGNGGANYDVTFVANGNGTITPATLTVTAAADSRVYDGTVVSIAKPTVTGGTLYATDSGVFTQAFADKNAGAGKAITAGGTISDGNGGGNYSVSFVASNAGTITPRPLNVQATGQDKTYDGTTAATAAFTDNRIAGDTLAVAGSAAFADKNAGGAKPVSVTSLALSGADAGNYTLASSSASTVASITPAELTIAADNLAKEQGIAFLFAGTEFSAHGLVAGETVTSVTLASAGAPATAEVGAFAITPSNAVGGSGFLASNYRTTYLNGVLGVAARAAAPEVKGQVNSFATLFIEEAKAQQQEEKKKTDIGKDDIVVTDTACKPS